MVFGPIQGGDSLVEEFAPLNLRPLPRSTQIFKKFSVNYITTNMSSYLESREADQSAAIWRRFVMSRNGGAPKNRLYSRLNCEGLS